jgi:hypothetical protein
MMVPVTVAMVVDRQWKGKGSFTFGGRQVNDCVVTALNADAAVETEIVATPVLA